MTQRDRDHRSRADRARGRAGRFRARTRLHRLRGRGVRRRLRAPLGPRAPVHPVGDERLAARARGRSALGARRARSCRRATSSPTSCSNPLAATLGDRIRLGTRVLAIGREGLLKHEAIGSEERAARPFRLLLADADGRETIEHADAVIDCSGTYGNPNLLGDGGIPAPGERALEDRIVRYLPSFDGLGRRHRAAHRQRPLRADRRARAGAAARHRGRLGRAQPGSRLGRGGGRPAARARIAERGRGGDRGGRVARPPSCCPARSPSRSPSATAAWPWRCETAAPRRWWSTACSR